LIEFGGSRNETFPGGGGGIGLGGGGLTLELGKVEEVMAACFSYWRVEKPQGGTGRKIPARFAHNRVWVRGGREEDGKGSQEMTRSKYRAKGRKRENRKEGNIRGA